MTGRRLLLLLVLLAGAAAAHPLSAQTSATVAVVATAPPPAPSGAGVRNLSFGTVVPSHAAATSVAVTPAVAPGVEPGGSSGHFRLEVGNMRGVTFSLALPAALVPVSGTAAPIPVSFDGSYAAHCVIEDGAPCALTTWNPAGVASVTVCKRSPTAQPDVCLGGGRGSIYAPGSLLDVYLGGLLQVPPGQLAGRYSATVTLTVVSTH